MGLKDCRPLPELSPEEVRSFWAGVDTRGDSECWHWHGATSNRYGIFRSKRKNLRAHRVSYMLSTGADPFPLDVLHRCDNPLCVRPDHLFLGTQADNVRDCSSKGRYPTGASHYSKQRQGHIPARGERHGRCKVTEADVIEIRRLFDTGGAKLEPVAKQFGLSIAGVSLIKNRKKWAHLP